MLLWGRRVGWAIVTRLMFVYYTGARIRLPIVSWERRFIDMAQSSDAGKGEAEVGSGDQSAGQQPEGDDYSESGGEGDGNGRGADGLYGVMLMSSTHHRFAGLFTIRRPGARPVTQLLVRGSPALWGQKVHLCATARCFLHIPMALGGLQARGQQPDVWYKCSIEARERPRLLPHCYSPAPHAGSDEETMAHLLMYSTNYTVRPRSIPTLYMPVRTC